MRKSSSVCDLWGAYMSSVVHSNWITMYSEWGQENKADTPHPVDICIICAGSHFTGSNVLGRKCQIIKLFNSSLSLYSWLVIKQHSINMRGERQWMTLSRLYGLNPCKLLGSTDWQLMFPPAATDENCWNDFESSNFPTITDHWLFPYSPCTN